MKSSADNRAAGTAKAPRGKPFEAGQSGNPTGRPKGTRAAVYAALDGEAEDAVPEILRKLVEAAKGGDVRSAELLFRRAWPERKSRPVALDLPRITKPADLDVATATLVEDMAAGRITPDEASSVVGVLELRRRAFETSEFAAQLADLQDQVARLTAKSGESVSDAEPDA